jgi:hypothetical protein
MDGVGEYGSESQDHDHNDVNQAEESEMDESSFLQPKISKTKTKTKQKTKPTSKSMVDGNQKQIDFY